MSAGISFVGFGFPVWSTAGVTGSVFVLVPVVRGLFFAAGSWERVGGAGLGATTGSVVAGFCAIKLFGVATVKSSAALAAKSFTSFAYFITFSSKRTWGPLN